MALKVFGAGHVGQLMQRRLFWLVAAGVGLAVAFTIAIVVLAVTYSPGGPSARDILRRSAETSQELRTAHIAFLVDTDLGGFSFRYQGEGDVELPDKVHVIFDFGGRSLETLILVDRLFIKTPFDRDWLPVSYQDLDFDPTLLWDILLISQDTEVSRVAENLTRRDTLLNGQPVHHFTYTLAPANFVQLLQRLGVPAEAAADLQGDATINLWVDRKLLYPRKLRMEIPLDISETTAGPDLEAQLTIEGEISRFNEPVAFPRP